MADYRILNDLRNLQILVVSPEGSVGDALVLQLVRIGCAVKQSWPPPDDIDCDIDVVFFSATKRGAYNQVLQLPESVRPALRNASNLLNCMAI